MEKYMKYFNLEFKISHNLREILKYSQMTYDYLVNPRCYLDKEDIIMNLEEVPNLINTVENLIDKLEETYEEDMRGEGNEYDE